jgi:hypothetical protein
LLPESNLKDLLSGDLTDQDRLLICVANGLPGFNSEATRRDGRWKTAKTSDDLGRMKEHDFLEVLESISVIGKKVRQELQKCLQLRNGCGHPNSLQIADHKVSAHIEDLILNVFAKFP